MSFLFGKKKKQPPVSQQDAIMKLRELEDMLTKKQKHIESQMDEQLKLARQKGTKDKRGALQALKRKKRYEQQLAQIDGQINNIEFQREALENAKGNAETLKTMQVAGHALKSANQGLDADEVHDLMDDISEAMEETKEISEAISNPIGMDYGIDEDDLLAELEELEQQDIDEQLLDVAGETLPDIPEPQRTEPAAPAAPKAAADDAALADLAQWAS